MSNIKIVQRRARDIEVGDIVRVAQSRAIPNPLWFEVFKVDTPSEKKVRLWRSETALITVSPLDLVEVQVEA